MPEPLDLAAVRARAAAARDLVTRLTLAGNLTDVGGAEALYIIVGDLEATLSRLEAADRLHRADHARVAELEREVDQLRILLAGVLADSDCASDHDVMVCPSIIAQMHLDAADQPGGPDSEVAVDGR